MKWVRFKHDFDPGGPLHELLKKEGKDKLTPKVDPNVPKGSKDGNIYISGAQDSVIDNNFRIYDLANYKDITEFENIYLDNRATYKDTFHFHKWEYEMEVSKSHTQSGLLNSYEIFAGGWVEFWDREVRHEGTDHALYFKFEMRGNERYARAYIMQTKAHVDWNFYLYIASPPTSTDPPTPPGKPPY